MSEPTNGGKDQSDPDREREAEKDTNEGSDQTSGSVFSDPTAPVWVDPTAPMPAAPPLPPTPPGAANPWDKHPAQPQPPAGQPESNPYAQQPPAQPYGQQPPAQPYGQPEPGQQYPAYGQQQPYGQPQPGQQYPAYGQPPYATGPHSETNASAIVLTIVSALTMLSTCVIGIPSLIFGIMALTSNSTDPVGSRKKSRTGWIIFAVNAGVFVVLAICAVAFFIASGSDPSYSSNTDY
jgi:hypothetical protein